MESSPGSSHADELTHVEPSTNTEDELHQQQQLIAAMVKQRLFSRSATALRIGRFTILDELGRGGMGVVYSAYDEQLDRKVAVKVLLDETSDREAQRRFHREGQAMARLSHPNVVTVHEVGEDAEQSFLAMEFIRGQSLMDWLRTEPGWLAVLEAFVQAGEGLAAAHRAGLVHRDLKPHNIMRRDDGVVKVLDFGLARADDDALETHHASSPGSALSDAFTRTGVVMGTPAYMAPEQMRGESADTRSDQFSFCVALYEGLYGERPFEGGSLDALLASMEQQRPRPVPRGSKVPAAVRKVVLRGLAHDPEQRWPSMSALLEPLRRQLSPRRRRGGPAVVLALVGSSAAGIASYSWLEVQAQRCTGAAQQLAGVWDDARRAAVKDAIVGIGKSYADDVWARTERGLDGYATDWMAMHTEACEATTVRGEQSHEVLDLRMQCLRRANQVLGATVDALASADAEVVARAHELIDGLHPLSRCADVEALAAGEEPPRPEEADAVDAARSALARAASQDRAGRYEDALAAVEAAQRELAGVRYGPVRTELVLQEGVVLRHLGRYEASADALRKALELASEQRQWDAMASAATELMGVIGYDQRHMEEGLHYLALSQQLSRGEPLKQAKSHVNFGNILLVQNELERAEAEYRAAMALREQSLGPEDASVAGARLNLANVLTARGEHEQSEQELRRVLEVYEKTLGPRHPSVAAAHNNLANTLSRLGKHEEAEAEYRLTLSLKHEIMDLDRPDLATTHVNFGALLRDRGELEQAEAEIRTALAIFERTLEPAHPSVAQAHDGLATILKERGKLEEAAKEALAAISAWETTMDPGDPKLAMARMKLAFLFMDLERAAEALPLAERAWAHYQKDDAPKLHRGNSAYVLADALWNVAPPAQDRERAHGLMKDALRWYGESEDPNDIGVQQSKEWLKEHRLR